MGAIRRWRTHVRVYAPIYTSRAIRVIRGEEPISWAWPILFVAIVVTPLAYLIARPPRYPISEEHNVAVFRKLADGDWAMRSDESGDFAYRPCTDFSVESMLHQGTGYIAERARWEERGSCKSIRATGLGFFWRDAEYNYRRIQ